MRWFLFVVFALVSAGAVYSQPSMRLPNGTPIDGAELISEQRVTDGDASFLFRRYKVWNLAGKYYVHSCKLLKADFTRYKRLRGEMSNYRLYGEPVANGYDFSFSEPSLGKELWCGPVTMVPVKTQLTRMNRVGCGTKFGSLKGDGYFAFGRFCGDAMAEGVKVFDDGRVERVENLAEAVRSTLISPGGDVSVRRLRQKNNDGPPGPQYGAAMSFTPDGDLSSYDYFEDGAKITEESTRKRIQYILERANEAEREALVGPLDEQIEELETEQASLMGPQSRIGRINAEFEGESFYDYCSCTFSPCLQTYSSNNTEAVNLWRARDRLCRAMGAMTLGGAGARNISFLDRLRELELDGINGDNAQSERIRQAKLDLEKAEDALDEAQRLREERDRKLEALKAKQEAEEAERRAAAREKLLQAQRDNAERIRQGHEEWLQCLADHGYDMSRVDQLKAVTQDC